MKGIARLTTGVGLDGVTLGGEGSTLSRGGGETNAGTLDSRKHLRVDESAVHCREKRTCNVEYGPVWSCPEQKNHNSRSHTKCPHPSIPKRGHLFPFLPSLLLFTHVHARVYFCRRRSLNLLCLYSTQSQYLVSACSCSATYTYIHMASCRGFSVIALTYHHAQPCKAGKSACRLQVRYQY